MASGLFGSDTQVRLSRLVVNHDVCVEECSQGEPQGVGDEPCGGGRLYGSRPGHVHGYCSIQQQDVDETCKGISQIEETDAPAEVQQQLDREPDGERAYFLFGLVADRTDGQSHAQIKP